MAHTLYFKDGTHEVLFSHTPEEFARILRDKLGDDAEKAFLGFADHTDELNEANDVNSALEDELDEIKSERDDLEEAKRQVTSAAESMQDSADSAHEVLNDLARDIFYGRVTTMQEVTEQLSEIDRKLSDIRDTTINY